LEGVKIDPEAFSRPIKRGFQEVAEFIDALGIATKKCGLCLGS
jgi:hypothetical protein